MTGAFAAQVAARSRMVPGTSCAEFRQHLRYDRLQSRQMNRRDFPKLLVVEALVFMPQDVSDPDNGCPRRGGVFGEEVRRQCFCGFRNDLHSALHRAAMHVTALILLERKAANNRRYALDLITNVEETG